MSVETSHYDGLEQDWKKEYRNKASFYEKLVDEAIYTLKNALDKEGIKYHAIVCRPTKIKDFDSLYNKVKNKKIQGVDLSKINDIAGIRVICLYRSDLESVRKIISKVFKIVEEDTSRTRTSQPFGYSSDHYTVRFPDYCKGTRYDDVKELLCEVQVRTILMDAWASVSHHLDYKQELDIPLELRTNFDALSGLFYVADTNFELFKKGVEIERQKLLKAAKSGNLDYESPINLDTLITYLRKTFPEHSKGKGSSYSELLSELRAYGYYTIGKIQSTVEPTMPYLNQFEKDLLMSDQSLKNYKAPFFADVGMIRIALPLADENYGAKEKGDTSFRKLITEYRKKIFQNGDKKR